MTQAPQRDSAKVTETSGVVVPEATTRGSNQSAAPYNELLWEVRLCFAAAAGCGLVGSAGWLLEQFNPGGNSLQALIVVGAFYVLMGTVRSIKLLLGGRESNRGGSGH